MGKRISVFIFAISVLSVTLASAGARSFLGVYCVLLDSTSADGQIVTYQGVPSLEFEVTVVNEEGGKGIRLKKELSALIDVEFRFDGVQLGTDRVAFAWSPPILSQVGEAELNSGNLEFPFVLAPGTDLRTTLSVSRIDKSRFSIGEYSVVLRANSSSTAVESGAEMKIEGGKGGACFFVRDTSLEADQLASLNILAKRAVRLGALNEAMGYYSEMDKLWPDNPAAAIGMGTTLSSLGEHERAIPYLELAYNAVIDSGIRSPVPLVLARSLIIVGDDDRALEILSGAMSPANAVMTFNSIKTAVQEGSNQRSEME
jgi:hypothetical protein